MNQNFNIEIAKMRSLMERINQPLTSLGALLNEDRIISEASSPIRTEYNDVIELLWGKNFQSAKFVGLGYVVKPEIPKKIFPSQANADRISQLIQQNGDTEWAQKLQSYVDNPKWGKIVAGKSKSASFLGGLNIIAVVTYNLQWQNGEKFGKFYGDRMNGEKAIAKKWGIDPMAQDQDKEENKMKQQFRTFYNGKFKNGAQPIFGGRVGDNENGDVARYADGTEKLALKHAKSFVKRGQTYYFYQQDDGNYVPIGKDIVGFLAYKLGNKTAKEVKQEVEAEAQSYEEELKRYKAETSSLIKQFLLRQVGYIAATVVNPKTGAKEPLAYVNKDVNPSESSKGFDVNAQSLYPYLQKLANVAQEETEEQAETATN